MQIAKTFATCVSRVLLLLGVFLIPVSARAQSVEEHDVETLEAAEVGEYRPEQTPDAAEVERSIVERTNEFRQEHDRSAVEPDETLQTAAQEFAEYMARTDRFGHTADGNRPSGRAADAGYEFCIVAENIAYQFQTLGFTTEELVEGFVTGWKNSPGHRENMLNPAVTETGVAIAQSEKTGVYYAVQMFGRPRSAAIEFSIRNEAEEAIRYRVGDREFELPPRFSRTHRRCKPGEFTLLENAGPAQTEESDESREVGTFSVEGGERLVVGRNADGELEVSRKETAGER